MEEEKIDVKPKGGRKAPKPATKNPRKNNKMVSKTESAAEPMEMSTNSEIETGKFKHHAICLKFSSVINCYLQTFDLFPLQIILW